MKCKQCGKDLAGEEYKMVAEWAFCPDCFQQLLEKPVKKAEEEAKPDAEINDVGVEAIAETAKLRCQLCEKEIEGDRYKKVGIWMFCPDCYIDLTPRPKPPPQPQPEEEAEAEETEVPIHARVQVKYIQRVTCAGCGKRIPEGGSKDVNGEPYCPDCYYALPEEELHPQEVAETAGFNSEEPVPSGVPEIEADPGCQSCGKEVPDASLKIIEGFPICQACLSSDAELAVHIARARHQKRLQRLIDELES